MAKKKSKIPRQYSLVKLDPAWDAPNLVKFRDEYLKTFGPSPYVFFGEIPNMQGHCVIINKENQVFTGYHTDNFVELSEDEV